MFSWLPSIKKNRIIKYIITLSYQTLKGTIIISIKVENRKKGKRSKE
jgi:hypothetical protein